MKKLLFLMLLPLLLVSCANESQSNPSIGKKTISCTIDFNINIQTTDSTSSKFNEVMLENFNQETEILSSVTSEGYAQINNFNDFKAMTLSSQKSDGSITFTFIKELKSLQLTISPYYKYIEYSDSYSFDSSSVILVQEEEWEVKVESLEEAPQKIKKTFEINKNTLILSGKAKQRVFIHKMEMEFIDE